MRPKSSSPILKKAGTPALLLTDVTNIRYLTGVEMSEGIALVTAKKVLLFVDPRYQVAASREAYPNISVLRDTEFIKTLSALKKCGYESENLTVARLGRMKRKYKNTKFVQTERVIEYFRETKDAEELRYFRKSQKITKTIMGRIPKILKGSITEKQLAWKIGEFAMELGAEGLSFDPIVAFGVHTAEPHHHPSNRKLKKGDIVQIDCGVTFKGYCSDRSEVFFTGKKTALQNQVYQFVKKAKSESMKKVKAGVTNHALDVCARNILKEENLEQYFTHSLGHGVGLYIHEDPRISVKAPKEKLRKGQIITIEPGVYLPGKFGIRLEEEVIVQ